MISRFEAALSSDLVYLHKYSDWVLPEGKAGIERLGKHFDLIESAAEDFDYFVSVGFHAPDTPSLVCVVYEGRITPLGGYLDTINYFHDRCEEDAERDAQSAVISLAYGGIAFTLCGKASEILECVGAIAVVYAQIALEGGGSFYHKRACDILADPASNLRKLAD